ncbi:MAG: FAD:protein FMN transferase [Muribaculaceae bacterium]|nr:FAD:protein FMN transferase [Muribaculaceae bacterium]
MSQPSVFKSRYYWAVVVAAIIAAVAMWCRRGAPRYLLDEGVVWTTSYHITYQAAHPLSDSIQAVLDAVDRSASMFNKNSLLTAINANATDSVDDIVARLMDCAARVNSKSGGAYDPTVKPLVALWGFGRDSVNAVPSRDAIDSVLAFVGMDKIELKNGHIVKSDPRGQLDFSSIAKGLACDMVADMLRRNGVENYVVEIGGEVVSRGVNPNGKPWTVSIDDPVTSTVSQSDHTPLLVVEAAGLAVATSGNYRRWRQDGSRRVSHIIDPATGNAAVSDLVSVTIIARDCMTADAWATACMAMGAERTQTLLKDVPNPAVMTVTLDSLDRRVLWSNAAFAALLH